MEGVGISAGTVFPRIIPGGAISLFFAPKWGDYLIEGDNSRQFCMRKMAAAGLRSLRPCWIRVMRIRLV